MAHTHIATRRFPYRKNYLKPGEAFTPENLRDADLLERLGHAEKAPKDPDTADTDRTGQSTQVDVGGPVAPRVFEDATVHFPQTPDDADDQYDPHARHNSSVEPEVQAVRKRGRPRKSTEA